MQYLVTATSLNLRNGPSLNDAIVGSLTNGQAVDVTNSSNPDWWLVSALVNSNTFSGYVASRYLREIPVAVPAQQLNPHKVIAVHYATSPDSNRASINARHAPLSEANLPLRDVSPSAARLTKIADVYKIADYLDVANSARYQPTPKSTYCNIYAYDFCYLAQAYLPRVWWMSKALMEFAKTPGYNPKPAYGKNVAELNANALYDWLDEWGDDFGWMRTYDLTDLQGKVNEGRVGIVCAKRRDQTRSGHISCVLPEANGITARRDGAKVTAPLQSQAGVKNKKFFSDDWWVRLAQEYSNFGYWYHD